MYPGLNCGEWLHSATSDTKILDEVGKTAMRAVMRN